MQNKFKREFLKATIISVIVAFLIIIAICIISIKFGKEKFQLATDIIDMITIENESDAQEVTPVLQNFQSTVVEEDQEQESRMILTNCPTYGSKYATLSIPSVGIELPVYYGKTYDLLKNGIGHDNESYFPGEGGSVIMMGHNFNKFLGKLPNAQVGDEINITTNYGDFSYKIYDTKIVDENDVDQLPVQGKEEILMLYTCWPINNIGYATQRYVVYAK